MSKKRTVDEVMVEVTKTAPKRNKTKLIENVDSIVENIINDKGVMVRDVIVPKPIPTDKKSNSKYMKIISWNVAGIRAILKNNPLVIDTLISVHDPDVLCLQETKLQEEHVSDIRDSLLNSINAHAKVKYTSYWSSSVTKKGYSGTAVFVKGTCNPTGTLISSTKPVKKQSTLASMWGSKKDDVTTTTTTTSSSQSNNHAETNENVEEYGRVQSVEYDCVHTCNKSSTPALCPGEGRTITIEFPNFFLINCYVPNSGQNLERLQYRLNTWDPGMRNYINTLQLQKPVVFTGDLNCGFGDLDIHNPHAKHIVKQAGLTPAERASFKVMLTEGNGLVDALRYFYPSARGQFTYWSQRTFARPVNKGIRLDYFICSSNMVSNISSLNKNAQEYVGNNYKNLPEPRVLEPQPMVDISANEETMSAVVGVVDEVSKIPKLYDSYILFEDTVGISDHCPVVLVMEMPC